MTKLIEQITILYGWKIIFSDAQFTGHVEKGSNSTCLIRVIHPSSDIEDEIIFERVCEWHEQSVTRALDFLLKKIETLK